MLMGVKVLKGQLVLRVALGLREPHKALRELKELRVLKVRKGLKVRFKDILEVQVPKALKGLKGLLPQAVTIYPLIGSPHQEP